MKQWSTEVKAIDPIDGIMKLWGGPVIISPTIEVAEQYCQENGIGYCKVVGELVYSIDVDGPSLN